MKNSLQKKVVITLVVFTSVGMVLGWVLTESAISFGVMIGMVCLILVLVFGLAFWYVKRLFSPVNDLQQVAEELDLMCGVRKQVSEYDDEFDQLRRTLAHLTLHLRERMQTLEGERAKVTAILDSMVEGVMALDAQGQILLTNPSARRIFDFTHEQLEERSLLEVVRNRELADLVDWCRSLNNSERYNREIVLTIPQRRVLEVNAMPLPLADHQRGLVLVLHDITKLRRLETVRAEFVANVSHELRTPLTAIKGYLETLLGESSPDPVMYRRFLGVALTHADRLGRLVNDLMNLSDIETGKITLKRESVSLVEAVGEAAGIYENEAIKKRCKH